MLPWFPCCYLTAYTLSTNTRNRTPASLWPTTGKSDWWAPYFACRVTFNPRDYGGCPTKDLYSQLSGRANRRARMQRSGRWPLLLIGSVMVTSAAELQLEPACARVPNTDVPRGKAEGINPQQTTLQQLGLIAQSLPLEVWVLGKLCGGGEVHGRGLLLIYQRRSVREELKLLSVAALHSHSFKIKTTCQPLTYLCVQGLKLQIAMYYVTQGNQYCLTLFPLEQGGPQWTSIAWHHTKTYIYTKEKASSILFCTDFIYGLESSRQRNQ